ncbi:hypothetical protein QYM36_001384 [Artemia franciscana]|uniref:Tubulin--tyrosine ligase-like protein 5 n=1 Tax=Artemia franciscana TaxID=6661 RepID=A0AA88LB43_ARTSF|nr:hypothetical protein QYM36_001384 [Artemia franciscana]
MNTGKHLSLNHQRSYELTRKDRLYKNLQRMQDLYGTRHFDFIPQSFILPAEYKELLTASHRLRCPWIVKPVASSRGRGIYLTYEPSDISIEEPVIVSRYIDNPLLIDDNKSDLRLYVLVTSYDPLVVYLYREGLVRCATVKYTSNAMNLDNPCVHLCNYSINKYHSNFRTSPDLEADDGHKRSFSSLIRSLSQSGKDTRKLIFSIEDLIIKTIASTASHVNIACNMFVPSFTNCFELYGFDILIDANLKPWLLEVNFSPSLGCDTSIDKQIKSAMLCDLLNIVGIESKVTEWCREENVCRTDKRQSGRFRSKSANNRRQSAKSDFSPIFHYFEEQHTRKGEFIRIFPTEISMYRYYDYAGTDLNIAFHNYLFPKGDRSMLGVKKSRRKDFEFPITDTDLARYQNYEEYFEKGYVSKKINNIVRPIAEIMRESPEDGNRWIDTIFEELKYSINAGKRLSVSQARKLFIRYLGCIIQRLPYLASQPGQQQLNLVEKFVCRVATKNRGLHQKLLASPRATVDDKVAFISAQLRSFIDGLEKECKDGSGFPNNNHLDAEILEEFCNIASETDFERLLALHTEVEPNCSLQFLFGRKFSDHTKLPLPVICEEGRLDLLKKACLLNGHGSPHIVEKPCSS